jgi:hypothetical protein
MTRHRYTLTTRLNLVAIRVLRVSRLGIGPHTRRPALDLPSISESGPVIDDMGGSWLRRRRSAKTPYTDHGL